MKDSPVLIIGCGIAGTAAAMALRRVGIEAVVYEAYERTAHGVGGGLGIASNGFDVLRTLGVDEQVRATGLPTDKITLWNGNGRKLASAANGTVEVTAERSQLYEALHAETLRRGIRIEHGKRLVDATQHGNQVTARFADGTTATGSLLIGADGMRSAVRRLVDPNAPKPHYVGLTGVGGLTHPAGFDLDPTDFNMVFGKRAFFAYSGAPEGRAVWFANVPTPVEPTRDRLIGIPEGQRRAQLLALFAQDRIPLARPIIEAAENVTDWLAIYHMEAPQRWYRDRMVLIGDAAHVPSPSSGQGASLALEDALVLTQCLRDRADLATAFATFQGLRERRVAKVLAVAKRTNQSKAAGPIGRIIRDALAPLMMKAMSRPSANAWLFQHHIDLDAPLDAQLVAK